LDTPQKVVVLRNAKALVKSADLQRKGSFAVAELGVDTKEALCKVGEFEVRAVKPVR